MQPIPPAPAGSILDLVARTWAAGETPAFSIRPAVRFGGATLIPVALDNGNDALKGATLRAEQVAQEGGAARSLLTTIRVPTAFALAQTIQGRQEVTYSCDGVGFWTGAVALAHAGDALRVGQAIQRLGDERQCWFIGAGIVELLRAAGHPPGEHQIALALGMPNTEIVIERDARGIEQLTLDAPTREVLTRHLKGKTWHITRRDDAGQPEQWTIMVASVLPQAQTTGTVIAITRSPNGKAVFDVAGMRMRSVATADGKLSSAVAYSASAQKLVQTAPT